jgi:mannose-6-phosphate isomerase-like protein (cupin superfamily)
MDIDIIGVGKPWGGFVQYVHNQEVTVKIITVDSGEKLSLQKHKYRDEVWVPLDNGLIATVDGEKTYLWRDKDFMFPVQIPRGAVHTMENDGLHSARFLEISFGHFDEDDIERLDDKYGRD